MEKYNGYTNYETWLTVLWLDNEEYTQKSFYELANDPSLNDYDKIKRIESEIDDYIYEEVSVNSGLSVDFINHCLSKINYYEILEHYKEE